MQISKTHQYRFLAMALGSLLVACAGLVSNAGLERVLRGEATGALAWGPGLFRALLVWHGLALVVWGLILGQRGESSKGSGQTQATSDAATTPTLAMPWTVLAGLSAVAIALRLWKLGLGLWADEIGTLVLFVRKPLGIIVTSFPNQNQHMFYSVLGRWSILIFGDNNWAVRLPAVLFGLGSIWALFFLGRRVMGTREALLACALMAVSYHHIWFSQNARGYTGVLLFATLSTWLWLEASNRHKWGWWAGYVISIVLGMWLHMTMAFVMLSHGFVYLIDLATAITSRSQAKRSYWNPIVAWVFCITATAQLYALALPQLLYEGLHEESKKSDWTNPLWVVTESLRSLQIGFAGTAVVLCGGLLVGIGWLSICKKDWRTGLLMVLPGLLSGGTMLVLGHNLWPRFFFFCMGFALLVVVSGAMALPKLMVNLVVQGPQRDRLAQAGGLALMGIVIVASLTTVPRCYAYPKQDYEGALAYVEQNRQTGDVAFGVGLANEAYHDYLAPDWPNVENFADFMAVCQQNPRVWVLYSIEVEVKSRQPEIWEMLQRVFEVDKVFPGTLGGGEVTVCRRREPQQVPGNVLP